MFYYPKDNSEKENELAIESWKEKVRRDNLKITIENLNKKKKEQLLKVRSLIPFRNNSTNRGK